jgi:arsenate reductase-like glutaredoxin family protein
VRDFSDEEVYREIGTIVNQYDILECDRCAKAVLKWLAENGIVGKLLKLKTRYREEFILSTRLERRGEGVNESITTNGTHYGVEVRGRVFDNLSTEGLFREDWVSDFSCRRGEFIVEELDSF